MYNVYMMRLNLMKSWLLGLCAAAALSAQAAPTEKSISLATRDGWTLSAAYLPAQEDQRTVILLHDLGKNKDAFAALRQALAQAGFGCLTLDLRGYGQSTGAGTAASFAREGVDNQFNKMTRDVDTAMEFLQKQGVPATQLCVLGAGLGANVAAKSMTFWPDTALLALLSPTANTRDVLTIPALRLYKGNVLIAAAAADKKMFLEASVIRNVAYLTTGPDNGQVTFLTAYDKTSHEMLDQYLIPSVIQWLKTPQRPEVLPDNPGTTGGWDTSVQTEGLPIPPSKTEDSLVPSILE